jgi:heme/copper-type cytochrome/quinol oxidase subunit 2
VNSSLSTVVELWYSFNATAGTTYRVWWNDRDYGDGTKTLRATVTAYDSNWNQLFSENWGSWDSPHRIILPSSSTIYLRVTRYSGSGDTFAIAYTTDTGIRPALIHSSLTANIWTSGSLATSPELWYSFDATAGTTYRVWWNESGSGDGDGTKTANVQVTAYDSNWNQLFNSISGWNTPGTITLNSSGTVYLDVSAFAYKGTFGIVYSTGTTRP